jgi:tetratricopeptide (TPR) repeat protein
VRLLEQALAIQLEVLGEDHPDVAQTLTNLATVHLERGATAEALVLLERALALAEKILGGEHMNVGIILIDTATANARMKRYEVGLAQARRAGAIFAASLGAEHPYVALALASEGKVLATAGRTAEARELYEQAMKLYGQHEGTQEGELEARFGLAQVLVELDRARAIREAEAARAGHHAAGTTSREVEAIEAWLAAHAGK